MVATKAPSKRAPQTKRAPQKAGPLGRPIWKGHISFGLVQIPVVLHSAEKRDELSFHLLDSRDHARIRYQRINEVTGEEVPWDDVVKAYEYDDNNYVILTDEDFRRAAVEATQTIAIETFVDLQEVNPLYYEKPYILVPGKHGEKPYALLRAALQRSKKVGIARVVIRTREYLSMVMVEGRALVLMLMRFYHELRNPEEHDLPATDAKKVGITAREIEMAEGLIEAMAGEFKPQQYRDTYYDALKEWIEKKARSGGVMPPEAQEEAAEAPAIINITDLLAKSLEGRKGKAEGGPRSTRPKPASPRKRATA